MPVFSKTCDLQQGYNFKKDEMDCVGYITSITIGDTTFTADQTVKDPMSPDDDLSVFAVLTGALWELGATDAVHFSGQVSISSKQSIQLLTYKDLSKIEVKFKFAVYYYDPIEKKYFKCMLGADDAELSGILEKNGSDLSIHVNDDPDTEVQSPENYAFSVGIKPQPTAQEITIATSYSEKVVKAWGITVS